MTRFTHRDYFSGGLKETDAEIAALLEREELRQSDGI